MAEFRSNKDKRYKYWPSKITKDLWCSVLYLNIEKLDFSNFDKQLTVKLELWKSSFSVGLFIFWLFLWFLINDFSSTQNSVIIKEFLIFVASNSKTKSLEFSNKMLNNYISKHHHHKEKVLNELPNNKMWTPSSVK